MKIFKHKRFEGMTIQEHRDTQIKLIERALWFLGALFLFFVGLCIYGILGMLGIIK